MDTRYSFKPGEEFEISEEAKADALKGALAANGNGNTRAKENSDIKFEDIEF